jgi:hypothetical protein
MISKFPILILSAVIAFSACQDGASETAASETGTSTNEAKQDTINSAKLQTSLRPASGAYTADSVGLHFTVVNHADTAQRFCKWETPFEPFLGKYLDITDDQGNEATFNGAMARRVMPPPAEAYIEVPAHDSVTTVYNIAKNYSLKKGQRYTVKYTGGGVSGLEAGNEINVTIP